MFFKTRQARSMFFRLVGVAVVVGAVVWWATRETRETLVLYIWDGYYPQAVIDDFAAEAKVNVEVHTYRSNAEMLARVMVSWSEFDIIMPTSYMISEMRRRRLLVKLDQESIPNLRNLAPEYLDGRLGDAENVNYAIPFMVNFSGIGYDSARVAEPPTTWAEFFSPTFSKVYGDQIGVLDEPRETLGAALLALGFSPNTQDEAELNALRELLQAQQQAGAAPQFVLTEGGGQLAAGELSLLSTWSPEITWAQKAKASISHVLPAEGSIMTLDTLAVPRTSVRQDLAKAFINFSLRPDIARRITEWSLYLNSLQQDLMQLDEAILSTPSFRRPPTEKIFVLKDLGEAQHLHDAIWSEYRLGPE